MKKKFKSSLHMSIKATFSNLLNLRMALVIASLATFSVTHSFGQCDGQIQLVYPIGLCSDQHAVMVYVSGGDAETFRLYKKVNGSVDYQYSQSADAPPVQFNFWVTEPVTYGISYTYNGCEAGYTEFTLYPRVYAPSSVTGTKEICAGQSTTLTANGSGAATYRWYEGWTVIQDSPSSQFNTGALTVSKTYKVAVITENGCESPPTEVTVTVYNPIPPTPVHVSSCANANVALYTSGGGFSEYQWYNQNSSLIGTTTNNVLGNVSPSQVTSYKVKVKDSRGCLSTNFSSVATVTSTHTSPPAVTLQDNCSTLATMDVSYTGSGSGTYTAEWFTTATGGPAMHSEPFPYGETHVGWTPQNAGSYWVSIYDGPAACSTPRQPITVATPTSRTVSGIGQSCYGSNTATVQVSGTNVSFFRLYYYSSGNYTEVTSGSSGTLTINSFNPSLAYYLVGFGGGCQTDYTLVTMNITQLQTPNVSGNLAPCYNTPTTLTASLGNEGYYRWYLNYSSTPISGATSSQLTTGNIAASTVYQVSHVYNSCESTKKLVTINYTPVPSITGFTVAPGTSIYASTSPQITLAHTNAVGTVTYEASADQSGWSASAASRTVSQGVTYFRAKAANGNCSAFYSGTIGVGFFQPPTITVAENVNYVSAGKSLTLSIPTGYASIQWAKEGVDLAGANSSTWKISEPGIYSVRVKGATFMQEATASITIFGNVVGVQNLNYISTLTFLKETKSVYDYRSISPDYYTQSTVYYDGLGRPMQSVVTQGSPSGLDIVQPIIYDEFGRDGVKYLPFTAQTNGWYKPNGEIIAPATTESPGDYIGIALNFYNNPTNKIADDGNKPFSETRFESSPLSRVIEQGAPGLAWQPNRTDTYASTDHTIKKSYETNTTNEVRRWTYLYPTQAHELGLISGKDASQQDVYYAPNELFKNKTKDEQFHEVIEYTDKEGRVVLKRVQAVEGAPAVNDTNFAATYYVYDDFGNLVCVVQPEGVKNISQYLIASDLDKEKFLIKWAFRYKYDARKRMIKKRVPGAKPVYMVYDKRDRLVMTQDGNQRLAGKWTFTKYDALNRPVLTGIFSSTDSADVVQNNVNTFYSTLATGTAWYESYSSTGSVHGYDNKSYPNVPNESDYLTVSYYDIYDGVALAGYTPVSQQLPLEITGNTNPVTGQVTGSKVKNLQSGAWMRTVNYYDDKLRVIQSVSDHHKGKVRISNVYDFSCKVYFTKRTYDVTGLASTTIVEKFTYDHAGRLLVSKHSINGQPDVVIAANYYNELGQLVAKGLHNANYPQNESGQPGVTTAANIQRSAYSSAEKTVYATNSIVLLPGFQVPSGSTFNAKIGSTQSQTQIAELPDFTQVIDYRYNIRGWLTHINDVNAPGLDMFTMQLRYNDPTVIGGAAQFNGNISESIWQTIGSEKQSYGYTYDAMNRLLKGQHHNLVNGTKSGRYNEFIGLPEGSRAAYDLNGNILNLKRWGITSATTYGLADDLSYDYTNNGNRLLSVSDAVTTNTNERSFKEVAETATDYAYDRNGNMTLDSNKGVNGITYNYLNLPAQVNKGTDNIQYIYDATGKKLSQQLTAATPKTTDYIGELVYENNVLQFVSHGEGRVVIAGGVDYQYFLKDHLGNVRATFATKPAADSDMATNEPANLSNETSKFLRLDKVKRVTAELFNRTQGASPGVSVRLNSLENERYGLARSIAVMPGDVVNAEVHVKYVLNDPPNWAPALASVMNAISGGTNGMGIVDGVGQAQSTISFPHAGVLGSSGTNGEAPKVYLNWIVFDDNMQLQPQSGFVRVTTTAREQGNDNDHERLFNPIPITITKPGYVYIYFSNENDARVDAFFDDFKVDHIKGNVTQIEDYYPFGLTFNSYSRENSVENQYLFNEKEEQDELDLDVFDYGARFYDPSDGRWWSPDPLADEFYNYSPYNFSLNDPVNVIDPDGRMAFGLNNGRQDITSTFIGPDGKVIKHIDDDDHHVYFVNDPSKWDGKSKGGLDVVGYEDPNKNYKPGDNYEYYNPREDPNWDNQYLIPASAYDYRPGPMPEKNSEDWDYLTNGKKGNYLTRSGEIFARDLTAEENRETVTETALEVTRIGRAADKLGLHKKKKQSTGKLKGAKAQKHDKGIQRTKQKYNDKKRKNDNWHQNPNKK